MKKRTYSPSIIFKLTSASLALFMMILIASNYLIARRQAELTQNLTLQVEEQMKSATDSQLPKEELMVFIDQEQIRNMDDFKIYAFGVFLTSGILGAGVFTLLIRRMLRPLTLLTEKVTKIDINTREKNDLVLDKGAREIVVLSEAFQKTLNKIYDNYEKERLLSVNVAHELRTPLAILHTKVDVFKKKREPMDAELGAFIVSMEKNITRLSSLVEEILFLGRDALPEKKWISLHLLVQELILDLGDRAKEKGVQLSLDGDNVYLMTDDALLERALFNLIDNGIKYNRPGGSCVISLQDLGSFVTLSVKDTGVGIQEEEREKVFDLFYRKDPSRNFDGGYGVGLTLVKEITRKLGGTVSLRENTPWGTIVELVLPKEEALEKSTP